MHDKGGQTSCLEADRAKIWVGHDGVADDYAAADGGYFAVGQTTASVDRMAGLENCAVLVGVWEDHGVVNVVVLNVVVVVKSKSVSKCKFCFKPVQFYGSRW